MTTDRDIEKHLYAAISGGRLSARTETVPTALREIGRRFKQPWTVAGVSKETWRRWNLAPDRKNAQRPRADHQAGLLAVLRRLRLSDSREAKMRQSTGIHVKAWDTYEAVERDLGKSTFGWTGTETQAKISAILDAYLLGGITDARTKWLEALPAGDGWAQEKLHPDSSTSSQAMNLLSISFMGDPPRAGRAAARRR